jgi:hypothetical protein
MVSLPIFSINQNDQPRIIPFLFSSDQFFFSNRNIFDSFSFQFAARSPYSCHSISVEELYLFLLVFDRHGKGGGGREASSGHPYSSGKKLSPLPPPRNSSVDRGRPPDLQ